MKDDASQRNPPPALFIGIDWSDRKHDCYVIDDDGNGSHHVLEHSPETIDAWLTQMLESL